MGTRMKANNPRKSSDVTKRRRAAKADCYKKQDLSWARTDTYQSIKDLAERQEKDRMKEIETRMETKNPRKKKVETKNPRKSSNVEERRNAAEADYDNNQDMSWARTDSDSNVRWWAAKIDYENKQDLSWARTDSYSEVRWWAAKADYENKRDLSWARTDNSENVRHWLKRQEEDRKRENKQKTKVMSGQKKNLANKKHIDKKLNGSDLFKKVLEGVFNFTLKEKGDERHGNGLDLWEQPWAKITETEGTGFLTGQAIKKIMEIKNIPEKARKLNEIKGAISYLVFYYLYLDKKE